MWVAAIGCVSCVQEAPAHLSRAAFPIRSACTATSRPPAAEGIDVRPGRRQSDARTLFVTNLGDAPRAVRVQQVSRVEGPCWDDWARQTPLDHIDAATREPPGEVMIQPGEWLQIEIGPQRVHATWDCTKLGLAVWLEVDEEPVCADAGAWIAMDSGVEE